MKHDYIHIKEDLRSIREDYDGINSKTEKILELSKNLEKMEGFFFSNSFTRNRGYKQIFRWGR
jgi:hypothetical protein